MRRLLNAGADKVSINTAAVQNPELVREAVEHVRLPVHRGRDRRQARGPRRRGRSSRTAGAGRPASTPSSGRDACRPRAPARSCSPAWTATARGRVRSRAHARGVRGGRCSGDRQRRRGRAASTWPRASLEGGADAVLAASVFHFGEFTRAAGQAVHARARHRGAAVSAWLDEVAWDEQGWFPRLRRTPHSGRVLMLAWMNREALARDRRRAARRCTGRARASALWRKGEESGHVQQVRRAPPRLRRRRAAARGATGRRHRLPHRTRALLLSPAGRRALGRDRPRDQGPARDLPEMKPDLRQMLERLAAHHRGAPRRRSGDLLRRRACSPKGDDAVLKKIGEEAAETAARRQGRRPAAPRARDRRPVVPLPGHARAPRSRARRRAGGAAAARRHFGASTRKRSRKTVTKPDHWRRTASSARSSGARSRAEEVATRTSDILAFHDINPLAPVHFMHHPEGARRDRSYDAEACATQQVLGRMLAARGAARARAGRRRRLPHHRQHRAGRAAGRVSCAHACPRRPGSARPACCRGK